MLGILGNAWGIAMTPVRKDFIDLREGPVGLGRRRGDKARLFLEFTYCGC